MGKNNRPGVQAVQELDPADLEDLEDTDDTEAGDTDAELLNTLAADGDEDADDFMEGWKPPAQLEAPPARPGFTQRWCRMSAQGKADAAQRLYNDQQGWKPRRIDTVTEADRAKLPTGSDAGYGEIITQGALVLCEMPTRKVKQRNAYYRGKNDRQMESMVTNPIAETNTAARAGFGPIKMSRTSKTTTGRKSIAQAD